MRKQRQNRKKLILGLSGGFASGKSSVARILKSYGANVLDADSIGRLVLRPGAPAYRKVVAGFGQGILKKDKGIDRARLGKIVFAKNRLLKRLNRITHPAIIAIINKRIRNSKNRVIVLNAALLLEAGLEKITDKLIVVRVNRKTQIKRGMVKFKLSKKEILQRINAQMPLPTKVRLADFVIDNNGTMLNTQKQISAIRRLLWKS